MQRCCETGASSPANTCGLFLKIILLHFVSGDSPHPLVMQQNVQKMANLLVEGGLSNITSPAFQKLQTEMTRKASRLSGSRGRGPEAFAWCCLTVFPDGHGLLT